MVDKAALYALIEPYHGDIVNGLMKLDDCTDAVVLVVLDAQRKIPRIAAMPRCEALTAEFPPHILKRLATRPEGRPGGFAEPGSGSSTP
jgi:hypothetical protein